MLALTNRSLALPPTLLSIFLHVTTFVIFSLVRAQILIVTSYAVRFPADGEVYVECREAISI